MAIRTKLSDADLTEAAAAIRAGETWKAVASAYQVDRRDLSRHFQLAGLDYRRRFYKCQGKKLAIPAVPTELAYLAGLFDGEGHLGYQAGLYSIQITNTSRLVIDWLEHLGGATRQKRRRDPKHLPCWNWGVFAQQDVLALLEAIYPYLIIKRARAADVIEEIGIRPYRSQGSNHSG